MEGSHFFSLSYRDTSENRAENITDYGGSAPLGLVHCSLWPKGIVPTTDFNSISANLLARYVPLPNVGVPGYSFNPVHTDCDDQGGLCRIDHPLSLKDSIWGYGLIEHNPGQNDLPSFGATLPGFAGTADRYAHQFAVARITTLQTGFPTTISNPGTYTSLKCTSFVFVAAGM